MKVEIMNNIKVKELTNILKSNDVLEFEYQTYFYQIQKSSEQGYCINKYSSNLKDEDGEYIDSNLVDGGICTSSASDAVEFL